MMFLLPMALSWLLHLLQLFMSLLLLVSRFLLASLLLLVSFLFLTSMLTSIPPVAGIPTELLLLLKVLLFLASLLLLATLLLEVPCCCWRPLPISMFFAPVDTVSAFSSILCGMLMHAPLQLSASLLYLEYMLFLASWLSSVQCSAMPYSCTFKIVPKQTRSWQKKVKVNEIEVNSEETK
jgi:hypothetical protein